MPEYKQQVINFFNRRSAYDLEGDCANSRWISAFLPPLPLGYCVLRLKCLRNSNTFFQTSFPIAIWVRNIILLT